MPVEASAELYLVGIGASAGGLEALESFFRHMPQTDTMSFVVIQHLSPDYESHMVELLSRHTAMPVLQAADELEVQAGHVYLIPRGKNMRVFKGKLYLMSYEQNQGLNLPIDIFFESLAADFTHNAIGIILSGTGSDGTRGIRAIKEANGLVLVQDDTARFDGMPHSAVRTRLVDFVTAPNDMPEKLLHYVSNQRDLTLTTNKELAQDQETALTKLFAILRTKTEIDFSDYKPNTILRRIERRLKINQIESLDSYVLYLQQSPTEYKTLMKEFLISVTNFFRDHEAFAAIKGIALPTIFENKHPGEQIRIWVAGCATGEEVYSLAILCQEYMQRNEDYRNIKLFATDIDRDALEYASQGIYPENIAADVSPDRLQNYFKRKGNTYEVTQKLRNMIVFAHHNLIQDPPFSKIDLISCRNLLIYLKPVLQKKVFNSFRFSLHPAGFLFLGNSETIGDFSDVFSLPDNRWKIYRYHGGHPASIGPITTTEQSTASALHYPNVSAAIQRESHRSETTDQVLQNLVEQILPPCVVVNEHNILVHAFGSVDQYLTLPIGYRVELNVLNMVKPNLKLPLSSALRQTIHQQEEVIYRDLPVQQTERSDIINIITRPFYESNTHQNLALVIFEKSGEATIATEESPFDPQQSANQRITDLERELHYTQENLQATIEEQETANEELQSTNEELLAANEELQSTNEELQSVNEELITVNNEYQIKITELTNLNDDVNNLLRNVQIATIFLDQNLNIRKFTPAAQAIMNLIPQDIGRPMAHLVSKLPGVDLLQIAQTVLQDHSSVETSVQNIADHWCVLRVAPYFNFASEVDGVVITLIDIMALQSLQEDLHLTRSRLEKLVSTSSTVVFSLTRTPPYGLNFVTTNVYRTFGFASQDLIKNAQLWLNRIHPDDKAQLVAELEEISSTEKDETYIEFRFYRPDNSQVWMQTHFSLMHDVNNNPVEIVGIASIRPEQREAELEHLETLQTRLAYAADLGHTIMWEYNMAADRFLTDNTVSHTFDYGDETPPDNAATWSKFVHPEDIRRIGPQVEAALRGETEGYEIEYRQYNGQGRLHHVKTVARTIYDDAGHPSKLIGTTTDITAFKETEETLRRDQLLLQARLSLIGSFIESWSDQEPMHRQDFARLAAGDDEYLIVSLDSQGRIRLINERTCTLLGYRETELVGQNWFDRCIPADDRPTTRNTFQEIISGRLDPVRQYTNRIQARDGKTFLVTWLNTYLHSSDGQIIGTLSAGTDIQDNGFPQSSTHQE